MQRKCSDKFFLFCFKVVLDPEQFKEASQQGRGGKL